MRFRILSFALAAFVFLSGTGVLSAQSETRAPSVAVNLNAIEDWSTQHPFINIAKTARPWFGHLEGRWGGISNDQLRATGHVNEDGWPTSIPDNATKLETVFFVEQPTDLTSIRGRYRITYTGDVDVVMFGAARNVQQGDGEIWFDFPDQATGLIGFGLTRINPEDPLTQLAIVHEDNIPLFEVGAIFNPTWLERVKDFRVFRFMPWMRTNNSTVQSWDDLPKVDDFSYTAGVPLSVMIRLSNLVGVDPWFTLPHMADDDLVRAFGETVERQLDPRRKAYLEYSNEIWNFQFEQTRWAQQQASDLWQGDAGGNAWIQYAGLRASQIGQILNTIYSGERNKRLVNVIGVHTAWMDLADVQLEGRLLRRELDTPIEDIFDAYAVTGYLRPDFENQNTGEVISNWHARGGEENVFRMLDQTIRDTRLEFLRDVAWPNHFARADKHGLDLIMYEGGTHVILPYNEENNPDHVKMITDFNYSPYMSALYQDAFDAWQNAGGELFNLYVDIAQPSRWGSWGHLRHLDDTSERWNAIMRWNMQPTDYQSDRSGIDFATGTIFGTNGATTSGTDFDDILIGSSADDVFEATNGFDLIHGMGGFDQLVLSGKVADYTFGAADTRYQVKSNRGEIWFSGIDYVVFPEEGLAIIPADLL